MLENDIAILMATYNGEKYLREQIDSLLNQTCQDWHLYIHDDGSTDNTLTIIKEYASQHPNIIILDYPCQHGAKNNFLSMIGKADASYYMFCDQDDCWFPQKIEKELSAMKQMEQSHPGQPLIVFSDLSVTDSQLKVTKASMWADTRIRPELLSSFAVGGVHEYITGCTMLFNQQAKDVVILPAEKASMHDTWLTLCVLKAGGTVKAVFEPLVYYRQHEENAIGASSRAHRSMFYKLRNVKSTFAHDYAHWQMLRTLHYGSFFKYLYYKYLYRRLYTSKK